MDIYASETQQILDTISRHCPESLSVYLHIINRVDDTGSVHFSKEMVTDDMSESWHKFKNNIKKLARENILEWHPLDDGIAVTLADINADE